MSAKVVMTASEVLDMLDIDPACIVAPPSDWTFNLPTTKWVKEKFLTVWANRIVAYSEKFQCEDFAFREWDAIKEAHRISEGQAESVTSGVVYYVPDDSLDAGEGGIRGLTVPAIVGAVIRQGLKMVTPEGDIIAHAINWKITEDGLWYNEPQAKTVDQYVVRLSESELASRFFVLF